MQQLSNFKNIEFGKIPKEWSFKRIGELLDEKIILGLQDGNHGELHPKLTDFIEQGIPFLTANCITNNRISFDKCKYLSKIWLEKLRIGFAKENDIILTHKGTLGLCAIVPSGIKNVILSPQTTYYRLSPKICSIFLFYFFQSKIFQNQLFTLGRQSTRDYVGITSQKSLNIVLPPLSEQQKIAYILSNVDELIQKTEQIIEQTQRLKKGLMQRLLTKGIGHSKFKKINLGINFLNYEVPVDWKLLKIKDIASVHGRIGWKGLKREEYTETGPLMLSVWSLTDEYPYGVDYSAGVNRLSTFRFDESPEIKLKNGDVLLAKDGDIGRIGYVKFLPEPSTVNSHVVVVRTRNDIINSEFLYWFMSSNPFQIYCKSFTSGTTVPLLSQRNIREAIILIPSLSEQNAISSTLYSFSNIIHKYRIYKNKIQGIKKGLMQQLLTGKLRVKA